MLMIPKLSAVAAGHVRLVNPVTDRLFEVDNSDDGDANGNFDAFYVDFKRAADIPINRWEVWQSMRRSRATRDANGDRL